MVKKIYVLYLIIFAIALGIFVNKYGILFVYNNPNVETSGIKKISYIIKQLDSGFNYAKRNSGIEYLYQNAYGSGFLKNNPIPNDLDYAIGVNLGTFEYNGKNSEEVAIAITEKILSFQYDFMYYMSTQYRRNLYLLTGPFELLNRQNATKSTMISDISDYIDIAINSKSQYIRYTTKTQDNITANIPYVMKSGEILLQNMSPIIIYTAGVLYNDEMLDYLREVSVIPEYYFTLVKDSVKYKIEIVPESFIGARLQISRRFFAPAIFVKNYSVKFLKEVPYLTDEEMYMYLRMLSFSRHLQEVKNIKTTNSQPVKLLKRLMQCADIIKPMLTDSEYKEISDFVYENLSNKEIRLLNEYNNICSNIFAITKSRVLYNRLVNNGELDSLYNLATSLLKELEPSISKRDKAFYDALMKFHNEKLKSVTDKVGDVDTISNEYYLEISDKTNSYEYGLLKDFAKIDKFVLLYNDIYQKAGYKPVYIYWLDKNTIGILKDKNTVKITNPNTFAKERDLPSVNYKFVSESEIPKFALKHALWLRFASTDAEDKYYNTFRQKLLDDRANFKIRKKFVLF